MRLLVATSQITNVPDLNPDITSKLSVKVVRADELIGDNRLANNMHARMFVVEPLAHSALLIAFKLRCNSKNPFLFKTENL